MRNLSAERHHELGEAEKDLAYALVKLQERSLGSALMNASVAIVRMSKHVTEAEFQRILTECAQLTAGSVKCVTAGP